MAVGDCTLETDVIDIRLSLLICSIVGVRQRPLTSANGQWEMRQSYSYCHTELICYLREKVAIRGNKASISLQGLQRLQKITKEQYVPLEHFGGMC